MLRQAHKEIGAPKRARRSSAIHLQRDSGLRINCTSKDDTLRTINSRNCRRLQNRLEAFQRRPQTTCHMRVVTRICMASEAHHRKSTLMTLLPRATGLTLRSRPHQSKEGSNIRRLQISTYQEYLCKIKIKVFLAKISCI